MRALFRDDAWFLLSVVALRFASEGTTVVAFLLLALYAWMGRRQSILAIFVCFILVMANGGLAADSSFGTVGRYLVFLSAAGSNLVRVRWTAGGIGKPVFYTLALGAFLGIHSLVVSPVLDVSLLKAVSWTILMATLLAAWGDLRGEQRLIASRQVFGGLALVVVASLPLVFTGVGYFINGSGFQGLLAHPQSFGPVAALVGVWAGARMLASPLPRWSDLLFLIACIVVVFLSEARIAGGMLVLGLVAAVMSARLIARAPLKELLPAMRSRRLVMIGTLALGVATALSPLLSDRLDAYISKRTESRSIAEAYQASRGGLIDTMVANVERHPLLGIGFGIASDPSSMVVERDAYFNLPVAAATEKGVMPVAVLEETGLIGALAVALWIFFILRRSVLNNGVAALAVVYGIVILNLGENTLFSPGGLGMLTMVLLGWAATGSRSQEAPRAA